MALLTAFCAVVAVAAVVVAARARASASSAQAALDQLSHYDRLTGLPNRSVLHQGLDELLRDARRTKARVAVISIELRAFAAINATYGHETGDELMAAVARRLRKAQRSGDRLVRYGGPQFVVMCPDISDATRARRRADEFLGVLAEPFQMRDDNIRVAANAGIAVSDRSYTDAEALVYDATVALADAATAGPGSVSVFDHSLRTAMSPSNAEHRLRTALERGEFELRYLPIVSLSDRQVIGVEALLRWSNPDRGLVNPGDFLKSLDDSGLIVPVGEWVLAEAARQSERWRREFPERDLVTTVNISSRQLGQADFVERVRAILEEEGADPTRLCFEVAEESLAGEIESAWVVLREIRQLGVRLSLDDFGVGHSSLDSLRRFRLDMLKIDRTFVEHLTESSEDSAIVRHIIDLSHAVGMVPVAEGVESAAQADALAALGCDAAQGFTFATPQTVDELTDNETVPIDVDGAAR